MSAFGNGVHRKRYYVTNALITILCIMVLAAYWWIGSAEQQSRVIACENQRAHIRNLNDWVKRLRSNDEHIISTVQRKQKVWVENRIHIFGEYLIREQRIDYGVCP